MSRLIAPILSAAVLCCMPAAQVAPDAAPAAPATRLLPDPPPPLPKEHFQQRRAALGRMVALAFPDTPVVILLRGAGKRPDMAAFVQEQDFLYLSGIAEPDLAMLLVPDATGALVTEELLVPPFSRFAATWDGDFLAPGEAAAERTGFPVVGNVRGLQRRLETVLAAGPDGRRPLLLLLQQPAPITGSTPGAAGGAAQAVARDPLDGRVSREAALQERIAALIADLTCKDLTPFLARLRVDKTDGEIALLRASAAIAAEGIAEAMRSAASGRYEFQLAAVARYVFSLRGAGPDAYAAIVGAGPNGCVLHYNRCDRRLQDGDLVVMDYAATLHGYASDVTRTFPANGRFTPAQRKLVTDVHEIQQALLADVRPGARLSELGRKCSELLRARGYRSDHGPCHHVGLAVHDPSVDVLAPGMVITVEPGAYLRDVGMGCRIEDTVLVTEGGHQNLSGHLPADPDGIEALMAQPGVIEAGVGLPR